MKYFKTLIFGAVALGVVSCSPKLYTANTQNVPVDF